MLKSVKEIAVECGISRQAVYKRLNKTMQQELQPFIIKKDQITYVLPEGVELIKQSIDSIGVDKEVYSEDKQEHREEQDACNAKDLEHVMQKTWSM